MGKRRKNKGGSPQKSPQKQSPQKGAQQSTASNTTPPTSNTTNAASSIHNRRRTPLSASSTKGLGSRALIIVACLGYFAQKQLAPYFLPYGPAVNMQEGPPRFQPVDPSNDKLRGKHGKLTKIYERLEHDVGDDDTEPLLLQGPETVLFHPKSGTMYVLTQDALLVSLTDLKPHNSNNEDDGATTKIVTAKTTKVANLGTGRPMGARFTSDGKTLYIADALLGLLRIVNPHDYPKSKVEIVANQVTDGNNTTKILHANDVIIGPRSGKVYFTDSSDIGPERMGTQQSWDTMYAATMDWARGKPTGRLLEYNPKNNQLKVLATGLWFSNGLGIDRDESSIMVAETFAGRVVRYHLKGSKVGTVETLVDSTDLPGFVDGLDCGPDKHSKCYATVPSAAGRFTELHRIWRNLVLLWPRWAFARNGGSPYGGVVEVDPKTQQIQYFQDPNGADIAHVTGVTVWKNKLYLGSSKNNFIGAYDLKK
ncbi:STRICTOSIDINE SYNTHASE-LIKE [Seminavis robusta]|uniref:STRICTOSIDINE SYNTHASE-LIKE n=1 Tax=Seminavis robusta TaxID=568900 RepID=A0A9N8HUM1_9STRA|nr:STRICTOSIDINE SYNTHASE-LIKE [Seminavis robusta]|eukprot:Sro1673_g290230.1 STRICTOSIDINE SYNTHASE-LIKE (480) ;mRNA; f:9853-11383